MADVVRSGHFILGPKVVELEERIAEYCQTPFAVGVSSGTDALLMALMADDIQPGDEVITTPFTFFATAGSIARSGARAVMVDIDPTTFNIDPAKIEQAITPKTKAIMPVHLYGQCADMDPILEIAKKHKLTVIEDAAQAIGSEYKGRRAGSLGDFGCFSFFPTKNLGGFGDGGIVTTHSEALYEKLKILRNHGMEPKYYHKLIGGNFRIDALQAAVVTAKLGHLERWTASRRGHAGHYNRLFEENGLTQFVATPREIFPRHIYNQYIIRVKDGKRDALRKFLGEQNIITEIYYPVPLHLQECFAPLGYKPGDFPVSEQAAEETLALPIAPEITQQQQVVAKILEFFS
ncbi:MAG: DegT/DnrJ/EryC1/StrS family aminotransferase [Nitrospina sp.]|nr:MAG: DegT/DnrJ/EryC1/StrS family aminotransferase [Nitrospina sp.]